MPRIGSSSIGDHTSVDSGYNSLDPSPTAMKPREIKALNVPVPSDINDLYTDIRVQIADLLRGSIKRDVLLSLKYLAVDNSSGRWYIIAQCDADVYKKVCKFFKRRPIQTMLDGKIFTKVIDCQVTWLLSPMDSKPSEEDELISVFCDDEERETFCGMRIELRCPKGNSEATFGGLIKVIKPGGTSFYGMTASHGLAHLFHCAPSAEGQQDARTVQECLGDADSDDESVTDSESEDEDDGWDSGLFSQLLRPAQGRQVGNTGTRPATVPRPLRKIGKMGALLPNSIPSTTGVSLQKGKVSRATFTSYTAAGVPEPCVHTLAITRRGPQRGTLKVDSSSALISPGSGFVNTFSFAPEPEFGLSYGDSGSWVVHPASGVVFGHVVAVDCFGEARVIPMNDTLADIKAHLEAADVSIPTNGDVADISTDGSGQKLSSHHFNTAALDPLHTRPRDLTADARNPPADPERIWLLRPKSGPVGYRELKLGTVLARPRWLGGTLAVINPKTYPGIALPGVRSATEIYQYSAYDPRKSFGGYSLEVHTFGHGLSEDALQKIASLEPVEKYLKRIGDVYIVSGLKLVAGYFDYVRRTGPAAFASGDLVRPAPVLPRNPEGLAPGAVFAFQLQAVRARPRPPSPCDAFAAGDADRYDSDHNAQRAPAGGCFGEDDGGTWDLKCIEVDEEFVRDNFRLFAHGIGKKYPAGHGEAYLGTRTLLLID